jgi:hypothetical protein
MDRSWYKFLLVFAAVLPFFIFHLAAGSFLARGFLFSICYLAIASIVAWKIPNRVKGIQNHGEHQTDNLQVESHFEVACEGCPYLASDLMPNP